MTNNTAIKQIKGFFGKSLIIGLFLTALSVVSFAQLQTVSLINKGNNGHEGYIYVYSGYWQIGWSSPGLVTNVVAPCTTHSDSTWTCTTHTYSNGRLLYKGEIQSFTSKADFQIRNTHKWVVNHWESEYNDGWTPYYIR